MSSTRMLMMELLGLHRSQYVAYQTKKMIGGIF